MFYIFICFHKFSYSIIAALADEESVRGPAPSMGRITGSASIETLVIIIMVFMVMMLVVVVIMIMMMVFMVMIMMSIVIV